MIKNKTEKESWGQTVKGLFFHEGEFRLVIHTVYFTQYFFISDSIEI